MNLCDLYAEDFRIIKETRRPVDERGIDGRIILHKMVKHGKQKLQKGGLWVAAHYAKQNMYGAPVPIHGGLDGN